MRIHLAILLISAFCTGLLPAQELHPGDRIPADVHIYAEVTSPELMVTRVLETPLVQAAHKSGALNDLTKDDGFQKAATVWKKLSPRFKGRAALGIRFGVAGPAVFFTTLHNGKTGLDDIAQAMIGFDPELKVTDKGVKNGMRWQALGKGGVVAVDDHFLYWCERPSSLRELSRLEKKNAISQSRRYTGAMREAKNYDFFGLVSVADLLEDNPLTDDRFKNAVEILMFRAFVEDLRQTQYGYLWGNLGSTSKMRARLVNKSLREAAWDLADHSRQVLPEVPEQSGHIHLDRDLAAFWAKRLELVPEAGRPGLAEFSQTMNIFLSGFPFSDLMAKTGRGLDVVVREVPRSPRLPDLVLPQFAFVMDASFDRREQERFMVAFQTAIGVINADASEERREPMLQGSETVAGVQILTARFLNNPRTENRGTEYNFTPSIAFSKGKLILSSAKTLALDLVRTLETTDQKMLPQRRGDRLYLSGAALHRMLALNRQNLVESRMLDEGEEEEEAEASVDTLMGILKKITYLRLNHVSLPKSTVWDLVLKTEEAGGGK